MQTVQTLFGDTANIQYRIPIYQRRYVWDNLNWESLWTDINENMVKDEENIRQIFAGIIVTRQENKQNDTEIYDVIDGQQRLTTFQIILCLIRRHILSESWKDHRKIIPGIDHLMKYGEGENLQNKLWPKEKSDDEEVFQALVKWDTDIPVEQDDEHVLLKAFRYFKKQIEAYNYGEIHKLYRIITLSIVVAQINVTDEDDSGIDVTPEKLFASLNATGRMLSEFDYLRNDLFLRAEAKSGDFYTKEKYWHRSFENDILDLDLFLRAFLKAKLGPHCFENKKKSFEVYQQDYRKTVRTIEEEFEQLSAYAQFNEDMNDSSSEIGRHMQFYEDLQIPFLDAFLLFAQQKVEQPELPKIYKILESYVIRDMLCTGQYNYQNIESFLSGAINGTHGFSVHEFAKFLSHTWPDYEPVKNALKGASLVAETSFSHRNIFLYIFYRIELYLRNEKGANALPFNFKDLKTLEQIVIPDDLEEDLSDDSLLDNISKVHDAINSIGNIIALVTDSPGGWKSFSFTRKQSVLNKTLAPGFALNECILEQTEWGLDQITERTDELYSTFCLIWPYANKYL